MPMLQPYLPSPLTPLKSSLLDRHGLRLLVKRDDLLQPTGDHRFCGNKVRKLKYNLAAARHAGMQRLLTFGGAYSNHIAAVGAAGNAYGFETIGVIRGEAHTPLNPSLAQAQADGMQLHYLDRQAYRQKHSAEMIGQLRQEFGDFYLLPEGGTNDLALRGSAEIIDELKVQLGALPDYLCAACGTGGTLAGLIRGSGGSGQIIGVSALKGDFMQKEVECLLQQGDQHQNWSVRTEYHFGGYARFPTPLRSFVQQFREQHGMLLDPVYTAKLFYGVFNLIEKGFFLKGSSIVMLHSGGLQGWGGFAAL